MATARPARRSFHLLLWLTALHAAALYMFTTGFFLTRFEVPDVSTCAEPPHIPHQSSFRGEHTSIPPSQAPSNAETCWMPPRFQRIVFLVIDALRFDFAAPSPASEAADPLASFYRNHLPILNATLHAQPNNAMLLRFVADAPTMTMQRLKGLTTGGLPTFLDIKDNVASSAITEDNLIRQLADQHRPIVFMGDDTWDSLYSQYFTRAYAFDSFNVRDLDTVDRGVKKHLFPELAAPSWGFLVAHFLGVDHVGHTHGPSTPFMTTKLKEMNEMLTRVLQALDRDEHDDTLLLVLGDHGMSADGNHGGASDDETGAALFVYSRKPIIHADATKIWGHEIPQVDIVPTMSLLTGLPIPFGNLGAVLPHLFCFDEQHPDDANAFDAVRNLAKAQRLNVDQVRRYLFTYSAASSLPASAFDDLERIFARVSKLEQELDDLDAENDENLKDSTTQRAREILVELTKLQQQYLRNALALGRSVWTQFDLPAMGWGLSLLVLSIIHILHGVFSPTVSSRFPWRGMILGLIVGLLLPGLPFLPHAKLMRSLLIGALVGSTEMAMTTTSSLSSATSSSSSASSTSKLTSKWVSIVSSITTPSVLAFFMLLLHSLALLSNSFIVAEHQVLHFLSTTIAVVTLLSCLRDPSTHRGVPSCLVLLLTTRWLQVLDPPNIILTTPSLLRTALPLVLIFVTAIHLLVSIKPRRHRSLVFGTFSILYSCVAVATYWYAAPIASTFWRLTLPRSVFFLFLVVTVLPSSKSSSASHPTPESLVLTLQLTLALALVLGPTSPLSLSLLLLQFLAFFRATSVVFPRHLAATTLLSCIFGARAFFATGHQNTFTSLQNAAAFVGVDTFHLVAGAILLAFNTFGAYALHLAALPASTSSSSSLYVVGYFVLATTVSTAFVGAARRHLMVWAIFAPKFLFDAAAQVVLDLLLVLKAGKEDLTERITST